MLCRAAFVFRKSEMQMARRRISWIFPEGVTLIYGGTAGVIWSFHPNNALAVPGTLPCLHIEDEPDYAQRGVLYDISRDRMPTLEIIPSSSIL
ncbi:MAG: hypothetical protein ACLTXL_06585 [Clostridia bacterium]